MNDKQIEKLKQIVAQAAKRIEMSCHIKAQEFLNKLINKKKDD
jgi:hypothetical protein